MIAYEIITIVATVLVSAGLVSLIQLIIFRKQNKTIKTSEAKSAEMDVDKKEIEQNSAQIDLGNKFIESSMKIMELMKKSDSERDEFYKQQDRKFNDISRKMDAIKANVNRLDKKVDNVAARTERIEKEMNVQTDFLNGELAKYKESKKHIKTEETPVK